MVGLSVGRSIFEILLLDLLCFISFLKRMNGWTLSKLSRPIYFLLSSLANDFSLLLLGSGPEGDNVL